jgi:hypothetical protein
MAAATDADNKDMSNRTHAFPGGKTGGATNFRNDMILAFEEPPPPPSAIEIAAWELTHCFVSSRDARYVLDGFEMCLVGWTR